jgi:hypothetical protein
VRTNSGVYTTALCLEHVPEGNGVSNWYLGTITHHGPCDELVSRLSRDYTASRRGRLRRRTEWQKAILAAVE